MNKKEPNLSFGLLLLPFALVTLLGALVSPRDAQGQPLLLLPDVKAVQDYRQAVSEDVAGLNLLGGEIADVLSAQNTDLFGQSRQAQSAFEHALNIAQAIDTQGAPPALDGLQQASAQAASSYLEAARLALRWVSLPEAGNRTAAETGLTQAQQQLQTLEGSQWLTK